jgi:hypothetical protein
MEAPVSGFDLQMDHAAVKVPDLSAEVERWLRLSHPATFGGGTRLALLGSGSSHPAHPALSIADGDRFAEIAPEEGGEAADHEGSSHSFYAMSGPGLALEWARRPCLPAGDA